MSFAGFFKSIGHFFEKIFGADALHKFEHEVENAAKQGLLDLAHVAVTEGEKSGLTGEEKFSQALNNVLSEAAAQGKTFRLSLVRYFIELAVQGLKAKG
jgi:hypothetical protein